MPTHRPASRPPDEPPLPTGLPVRPALRDDMALVWRDPTTLEIGDPPTSRLVDGCTSTLAEWILALDGSADVREVVSAAVSRGISADLAAETLRVLDHAGAIDDLGVPPPLHDAPTERRLSLLGQIAAAGHAYGSTGTVTAVMAARHRAQVEVSAIGPGALQRLAEPVASLLSACGIGTVTVTPHPVSTDADLHILVRIGHPDLPHDAGALPLRRVHLPVVTIGARAVIGPLVEPGHTPCLRCLSLSRGDVDPLWPRRSAQLARGRRRRALALALDSALLSVATGQAALMAVAWIDARVADPSAVMAPGRLIDVRLPGAIPVTHSVTFHPDCACRDLPPGILESA